MQEVIKSGLTAIEALPDMPAVESFDLPLTHAW
jgi:hypothetical protein